MDSAQASKFGTGEQKVRLYEEKKLSFQAIDLKVGTIVEGMYTGHHAKFQVIRLKTEFFLFIHQVHTDCFFRFFEQMVLKKKTQFSSNQLETHQKDASYLYLLWCQVTLKNLSN